MLLVGETLLPVYTTRCRHTGIHHRTFFVPGTFQFGSGSVLQRLLSSYPGLMNVDIVDIGPVTNVATRTDRLYTYIHDTYPEWSDTNPINLVGQSAGCNTILSLLLRHGVSPDSINAVVLLSPAAKGFGCTYALGRHGRFFWYWHLLIRLTLLYEYLVPACVRKTLLFDTQLPPSLGRNDDSVAWSVFRDMDELVATELCNKGRAYIQQHGIRCQTLCSSVSVLSPTTGHYRIPPQIGPSVVIRLLSYIAGVGVTTDHQEGYSLLHDDVSTYTLRNGHHDGILLTQSQHALALGPHVNVFIDHVGSVLAFPLQSQSVVSNRVRMYHHILTYLQACNQ